MARINLPKAELLKVRKRLGGRRSNAELGRTRDHLTPAEVEALIHAAGATGRHRLRDKTLVLLAYRHGLRVSELINLQWDSVDFKAARLHVVRLKKASPQLTRSPVTSCGPYATCAGSTQARRSCLRRSEVDRSPRSATVNKLITRAGGDAGIKFPVTPHQLRHACGYYLANRSVPTRTIQEYLGHRNISNTQRYTALSAAAFKGLWDT